MIVVEIFFYQGKRKQIPMDADDKEEDNILMGSKGKADESMLRDLGK